MDWLDCVAETLAVTDFDEATFQRIYLSELALRIARTFYPFDPSIDVAKDAAVSSLGAMQ